MRRALLLAICLLLTSCGGDRAPFSGVVTEFGPARQETDNRIRVSFRVTNEGERPAKGRCIIRAYGAGDQEVGSRAFTSERDVPPGKTQEITKTFVINGEVAEVRDVEAERCRQNGIPWWDTDV